jgi:Uma2 family endonuclease
MRTVVAGQHAFVEEWIARRRARGQDLYDEVWHGEYHVAPALHPWHAFLQDQISVALQNATDARRLFKTGPFNLGRTKDDFRVPDLGVHRVLPASVWVPTAAMVVEVVSPEDESWLKFDHYAAHGVNEMLIADPHGRSLHLFVLADGKYEPTDRSELLGIDIADVHAAIDWPGVS